MRNPFGNFLLILAAAFVATVAGLYLVDHTTFFDFLGVKGVVVH